MLSPLNRLMARVFQACAVAYLACHALGMSPTWLLALLKGGAVAALAFSVPLTGAYRRCTAAGLLACSIGDVLLDLEELASTPELTQQLFLGGLACFLVGHVFYARAFAARVDRRLGTSLRRVVLESALSFGTKAAVAAYATGFFALIWPGLPRDMRPAVAVYALVIATMLLFALAACRLPLAREATLGALALVVSDSLLGYNRFVAPLPSAKLLVMVTYYFGQWGIARSAVRTRG